MDSRPASVCASIVLYDSDPELVRRALESLWRSAETARGRGLLGELTVHLVDNSSGAASRDRIREVAADQARPRSWSLQYTETGDNRGFGAGNNLALLGQHSDFLLVLNPDVELSANALAQGLARMQRDPQLVLLSPRVEDAGGTQEFLCKRYPSVLVLVLRGFAPAWMRRPFQSRLDAYEMRDACAGDAPCEVPLASGCCMLLRGAAMRAVGGFDEDYFLYFEDYDLSLRLAREGRLLFDPAVRIVHHGGYAAQKGLHHIRLFVRSGVRFFRRHGWRWI